MFEGEKTFIFWIGLVILGPASALLFDVIWRFAILDIQSDRFVWLKYRVPIIVILLVFILLGLYMMKSGVQKEEDIYESENEIEDRRKDMIK